MNIGLSENATELCTEITDFAKSELTLELTQRDADCVFLEDNWQAIARKGILGLYIPEEYGGSGRSMLTTVKALEALGFGCPDNGLTLGVNGQMWAVQEPILQFGTDQQKQKYLTGLVDGSLKGAHGMTEAHSGSDAFSLNTTAEKTDGGYVLNGEKVYIGLGPVADVVLTFASTNPKRGKWGLSTFIVDANSPGVELRPAQEKMGLRTSPMGEVGFKDAFVPEENLLGNEGSGASIFNASMEFERSFIFTSHVGSMARQLDETIEFAKSRNLQGQAIGKHQAVSHRIAEMKVRLETARMFLYQAARMLDEGQKIPLHAAMTKLVVSEAFVENSMSAIRIHGGKGFLSEFGVDRDLRDAMGGVIYSGTSDIQRNLIAGLLGL